MFRTDLLGLLRTAPRSVVGLATELELEPKEIEDDLRHLMRGVRHRGYRITITPAGCQHCGFTFHADKLHRPSKWPRCRQTWISPPLVRIEGRERR